MWLHVFYFVSALVAGILSAWVFVRYLLAVERRQPGSAAFWDFILVVIGWVVTLTLWDQTDRSAVVLLIYALGSSIGTYSLVRRAKAR